MIVVCLDLKPVISGALRGYADLRIVDWGVTLFGCGCFMGRDGRPSVGMPTRPLVRADGVVWRDEHGKRPFDPVLSFDNRDAWRAFSDAAVSAIGVCDPEFFQAPDAAKIGARHG